MTDGTVYLGAGGEPFKAFNILDGHGVKIGDTIQIAALTPSAPFTVVGLGKFGKVSSLGGATMAVFDLPVAQRLLQVYPEAASILAQLGRPDDGRRNAACDKGGEH